MYQWENDTLVAIKELANGRFQVIELPARDVTVCKSRRSFKSEEQAENYIKDQYPQGVTVCLKDLELEQANRKLHQSPFQKRLDRMFFGEP